MKKSELVPGVEYACVMNPADNRYGKLNRITPFKATLVAVNFSEQRMVGSRSSWGPTIHSLKTVNGIAVDIGKKVKVEATVRVENKDGSYKLRPKSEQTYGDKFITREETFEYDYALLENAGCFIMTWAEWEQREQDKRDRADAEERRKQNEAQAAADNEPAVLARIARVVEMLGLLGEVKITSDNWREDNVPDDLYVMKPGSDSIYHAILHAEYTHRDGPKGERRVTGLKFTGNLTTIEQIVAAATGDFSNLTIDNDEED